MATTPFLMMLAARLASREQLKDIELTDPEMAPHASVIVVGHGRFGQTVAQIMHAAGRSVTIIDIKPEQIDTSQEFGRKVFYGDGTRIDLLRRAGAEEASAILFCIDDRQLDAETLEPVRSAFRNVKIFVRAYDRRQMLELMPDKSLGVYRELIESSINMAQGALCALGVSERGAKKVIDEFRKRDRARMEAQFESGNMRAGSEHSFGVSTSANFNMDED